ncbi:hypothetical protein B0H15DRAFT_854861 [Mycena belliarum]|uniref:F-box domain-containing protein n=1 Tax=Mycena belliarum TaxID=1033014 RepID=A0AAD6TZ45_9AGAR|nr:hypothetical protein B0H15DRAFT_854861 [Mycena belliae]
MKIAEERLIASYAHTNEPPSDIDLPHISHLLHDEQTALRSLDAQIAALRSQISELNRARAARAKRARKLSAITSPLRVLPPEILSLIFMHCRGTRRPKTHDSVLNTRALDVPLLLLQICSRWRRVALDTPRLWEELRIDLTWSTEPKLQLLKLWLVHARPYMISLAAKCYTPSALRRVLEAPYQFLQEVLPVSRRFMDPLAGCRLMKLYLKVEPSAFLVFEYPRGRLPLDVEDLRIELKNRFSAPATYPRHRLIGPYDLFERCPSLRTFTLLSPTISMSFLPNFRLPWEQLTHLRVVELRLSLSAMQVLIRCKNLVQCTIGSFENTYGNATDITTILHLTDLHLVFEDLQESITDSVLGILTLPLLKRLIIQSHHPWGEWSRSAFASFRLRSALNLESLELRWTEMGAEDFLDLLRSLPSLKNLTAVLKSFPTATIFRTLTCSDDSRHVLLPNLKRLSFGLVNSERSQSLEPLIAMVQSRRREERAGVLPIVARLEYLHLISYEDTPAIDRWWWELKLPKVFPDLNLRFDVCLPDVSLYCDSYALVDY